MRVLIELLERLLSGISSFQHFPVSHVTVSHVTVTNIMAHLKPKAVVINLTRQMKLSKGNLIQLLASERNIFRQ